MQYDFGVLAGLDQQYVNHQPTDEHEHAALTVWQLNRQLTFCFD